MSPKVKRKSSGCSSYTLSPDLTAVVTAGRTTPSSGMTGAMTDVPATVEPFLPAPPEQMRSIVGTRLRIKIICVNNMDEPARGVAGLN